MLGLVEKLIDPVSSVLDKVIEDKDQKEKLAHEIATAYRMDRRYIAWYKLHDCPNCFRFWF